MKRFSLRVPLRLSFFSTTSTVAYSTNSTNYSASTVSLPTYLNEANIDIAEFSIDNNSKSKRQSTPIKLLSGSECQQLFPMSLAIRMQCEAFSSQYAQSTVEPDRLILSNLHSKSDDTLFKPSYSDKNAMSIKIISVRPNNPQLNSNLSSLTGCILLFNKITGEPLCIMDGEFVTARRTSAGSGLATDLFAKKNVKNVIIFGSGKQANEHIRAVLTVRSQTIQNIYIINRSLNNATKLSNKYTKLLKKDTKLHKIKFIPIKLEDWKNNTNSIQKELLEQCDVICTTTNASEALFNSEFISNNNNNGVHINCIGSYKPDMIEIDDNIVNICQLFVDSPKAFYSGDLCGKNGKLKYEKKNYLEIGQFISENMENVKNKEYGIPIDDSYNNKMTLFESVGVSAQDLHSAYCIYQRACEQGVGADVYLS